MHSIDTSGGLTLNANSTVVTTIKATHLWRISVFLLHTIMLTGVISKYSSKEVPNLCVSPELCQCVSRPAFGSRKVSRGRARVHVQTVPYFSAQCPRDNQGRVQQPSLRQGGHFLVTRQVTHRINPVQRFMLPLRHDRTRNCTTRRSFVSFQRRLLAAPEKWKTS